MLGMPEVGCITSGVLCGEQCGLYGRGRQQPVHGQEGKGHLNTRVVVVGLGKPLRENIGCQMCQITLYKSTEKVFLQ